LSKYLDGTVGPIVNVGQTFDIVSTACPEKTQNMILFFEPCQLQTNLQHLIVLYI